MYMNARHSPRFTSAILQAIVNVNHVTTVELLQLWLGVVTNGNDKTLGIICLQMTFEDEESVGFYSNMLCAY